MSITTFIIVLICAVVILPSVVVFLCCFILGVLQSCYEGVLNALQKKSEASAPLAPMMTRELARAEAGKVLLSRIDKDENTTFH